MPTARHMQAIAAISAILLSSAPAPGLAKAALPPAGSNYLLKITTSFEPAFTDCWSFSPNGRHIYSPRLKFFAYQLAGLNTESGQVRALWQGRVSIGFAALATNTSISGDAVDAYDRTYSFTGTPVGSCAGQPISGKAGFLTQ